MWDCYDIWAQCGSELKETMLGDGRIVLAVFRNGTPMEESGTYQVLISTGDYDQTAYPGGEDTGIIVSDAYLSVMEGKTLTVPDKLCR